MTYVGKVLWGKVDNHKNHKPYLCVHESDEDNLMMRLSLVDLEYGDVLTLFVNDVDMLISRGEAYWDEA